MDAPELRSSIRCRTRALEMLAEIAGPLDVAVFRVELDAADLLEMGRLSPDEQ